MVRRNPDPEYDPPMLLPLLLACDTPSEVPATTGTATVADTDRGVLSIVGLDLARLDVAIDTGAYAYLSSFELEAR